MGAAWCRDRARAAHNSKSALDRVIVQICPSSERRQRTSEENSGSNATDRPKSRPLVSQPVPIHTVHRPISTTHALNASSKWEEVSLTVPDTRDEERTPIPPPRKKKQQRLEQERWKSVPRPPPPQPPDATKKKRRQKNLSTTSLPNSAELSLAVYDEKPATGHKTPPRNESSSSLTGKGPGLSSLTVEKIENCVKRCRSFGAFKQEQLKAKSAPRLSSESDDSFDGLDDWDVRVIEHYDAHESPTHTLLPPHGTGRTMGNEWHDGDNSADCDVKKEEETVPPTPHKEAANFHDRRIGQPHGTLANVTAHDERVASTSDRVPEQREESSICVAEHKETTNGLQDNRAGQPERVSFHDISHSEQVPGGEGDGEDGSERISAEDQGQDENSNHPASTGCERNDAVGIVYDFVHPKKSSTDVGLVNGLNGTGTPTGLKTPPPTPEHRKSKKHESQNSEEFQATHSSLLRLLKEYQATDGIIDDSGAQQVLKDLGLPPTLHQSTSRGSSGRSSMTPSLSELETALGDLLEASASRTGAEEDEEDVTPSSVQQSLRVITPKPFSSFSSTFHPVQTGVGNKQLETSA